MKKNLRPHWGKRAKKKRASSKKKKPSCSLLINVQESDEIRVAIVEKGELVQLFLEKRDKGHQAGNIYKARVVNIEPSLQAAFVNYGDDRNGFLHVSDVIPPDGGYQGILKKKRGRRPKVVNSKRLAIQDMLWEEQEVLVQIQKEGVGQKGSAVTSYISIPGRYLVLMPGVARLGVSKKISDEDVRERLRKILVDLKPPEDVGFIIRTASNNIGKEEIQADMNFLLKLWKSFKAQSKKSKVPACIYQESDLVIRTIRDLLGPNIKEIVVDSAEVHAQIETFLELVEPTAKKMLKLYNKEEPLFNQYNIEEKIEESYKRKVRLQGGGYLVFDQTEALVAIDVNTGKYKEHDTPEETIFDINMRAVREIANQIRLRDIGGLVMIDLVDMKKETHRRAVEAELSKCLEGDKAKINVQPISNLGVLEMTRQRIRQNPRRSLFMKCPFCNGNGQVKSFSTLSLEFIRKIRHGLSKNDVVSLKVVLNPSLGFEILNEKRREIGRIEQTFNKLVSIETDKNMLYDQIRLYGVKESGETFLMK